MKKTQKSIIIVSIISIISLIGNVYATTLTKNSLKESLEGYINGQKSAHTTLDDGTEINIEKLNEYNFSMNMSDTNIKINNETENIDITYNIDSNTCTFSQEVTVNNNMTEDEFLAKAQDSLFMPLCYISVCDVYGINSDESLNRISQKIKTTGDIDSINNEEIIGFSKEYVSRIKTIEDTTFSIDSNIVNETNEELTEKLILNVNLDELGKSSSTEQENNQSQGTNQGQGSTQEQGKTQTNTPSTTNAKNTNSKTNSSNNSNKNVSGTNMPYTGNNTNWIYITMAIISICGGISFIQYMRYIKIK